MKFSSFALAMAVVASASLAHAARQLSVTLSGCASWSSSEVERLAALELATVGGGESDVGSAGVLVECSEAAAVLTATEPRSRRSLTRNVPVAARLEDGERLIAISVAQLVRALDWLPEPVSAPPPHPPRLDVPEPRVAVRRRPSRLQLHLAGGPRARDHHAAFVTYRGALGSTFEIEPGYRAGGTFSYERGEAERRWGRVGAELLGAALQIDMEPWRGPHWSLLIRTQTGVARLTLRGLPSSDAIEPGQVRGLGFDGGLSVGPVLRWQGIGIALLAQVGGAEFGGAGLVTDGKPVSLNGLWGGAELSLLWSPD